MKNIINIIALAMFLVAIVCHSEIITLVILMAGTVWCVGFIANCILKKEEEERYIGRDF